MKELAKLLDRLKKRYSKGGVDLDGAEEVIVRAMDLLSEGADYHEQGDCDDKSYHVWAADEELSRPFLPDLYIHSSDEFSREWKTLVDAALPAEERYDLEKEAIDRVLYTAMTSFCVCYDLWKPKSRKTPGTFFEVLLGTLMQPVLKRFTRRGHVIIPGQTENVSTDIVFFRGEQKTGLVVPVKITTRERIVQPYAHQRILDSVFGEGSFRSVLVCVSEMQRAGEEAANAICVPGTIRLFQSHLAKLTGIYYLDPPQRYLDNDVSSLVPVDTVGTLLSEDLPGLVNFED